MFDPGKGVNGKDVKKLPTMYSFILDIKTDSVKTETKKQLSNILFRE